jgi:hypothetical protein
MILLQDVMSGIIHLNFSFHGCTHKNARQKDTKNVSTNDTKNNHKMWEIFSETASSKAPETHRSWS